MLSIADLNQFTEGSKFNIDADGNLSFKPSVSIPDKNKYTVIVREKDEEGNKVQDHDGDEGSIQSEEDVIFYIEKPEAEAELEAEQ